MGKGFPISVFCSLLAPVVILAQAPSPQTPLAPTAPVSKQAATAERHGDVKLGTFGGNDLTGPGGCCHETSGCLSDACPDREVCGPAGRIWVSAEYLLWWIKDANLPPLVTTGPVTALSPGAIGSPGFGQLFGGTPDNGTFSGGRVTAGFWLNDCQTRGIEASYFFLGSRSNTFSAASTGAPGSLVLARPFFDVSTGLQNSQLISFPGLSSGSVSVPTTSRFQGPEVNFISNLCCSCAPACRDCCDTCEPVGGYRVDLISGVRYLDLKESLRISETIQVVPGAPIFPGSTIRAFDQFDTTNQFYGGQIGVRGQVWRNRMFATFTAKVALGDTRQTVDISGATTITAPNGAVSVRPGGLLALPSNIGHYSRDVFSVVPEVGVNVGYQVTDHLSVFVGYNFLYWSDVARPGDQIDLGVNSTRTPVSLVPASGPARPQFTFRDSDFWAQGINVGVTLRY